MNPLLEFYKTKQNLSILVIDSSSFWLYCGMYQIHFNSQYDILNKLVFAEYAYQNSFQKLGLCLKEILETVSQIDLILCGVGPGSFTGVRIAVSTARNLSQFLKIPVITIDSLTLYSYALFKLTANLHFLIGFDAKQNKIYTKEFLHFNFLNTPIEDNPIDEVIKQINHKNVNLFIDNTNLFNKLDSKIEPLPLLNMDYFVDILFLEVFLKDSAKYFKKNFREVLPIYIRQDPATEKFPEGLKRI